MDNDNNKIINLSLGGGGIFGFAELGVLKEMEKYDKYLDIQNIKGVSVGSIVAALYVVGYTPDELTKTLFDMDLHNLIMDTYFTTIHLYKNYGMHSAKGLEDEIERLISIKTNIKKCTFSQIDKNLTIIATNLNKQCPIFFNRENTPDTPISKAVRLSTAYPVIMAPGFHDGDIIVDGGSFLNYPITTVPDDELDRTIGVTFSAYNENLDGSLRERCAINDVYEYIAAVGITMTRSMYLSQVTEKYLRRSIIVKISENINSMQFNLTADQKKYLYQCGINSAREQLHRILGVDQIVPNELIENPVPDDNSANTDDTIDRSALDIIIGVIDNSVTDTNVRPVTDTIAIDKADTNTVSNHNIASMLEPTLGPIFDFAENHTVDIIIESSNTAAESLDTVTEPLIHTYTVTEPLADNIDRN